MYKSLIIVLGLGIAGCGVESGTEAVQADLLERGVPCFDGQDQEDCEWACNDACLNLDELPACYGGCDAHPRCGSDDE